MPLPPLYCMVFLAWSCADFVHMITDAVSSAIRSRKHHFTEVLHNLWPLTIILKRHFKSYLRMSSMYIFLFLFSFLFLSLGTRSLYGLGYPWTYYINQASNSYSFCLPSVGIEGALHYTRLMQCILIICSTPSSSHAPPRSIPIS